MEILFPFLDEGVGRRFMSFCQFLNEANVSGFAIQTGFHLSIGSPEGTRSGMPNLSS